MSVADLESFYVTIPGTSSLSSQSELDGIKTKYQYMISSLNLDFEFLAEVIATHNVTTRVFTDDRIVEPGFLVDLGQRMDDE